MSDIINTNRPVLRGKIQSFEQKLAKVPGAFFGDSESCPLTHKFSGNTYVREIFIPKGTIVVGKIHQHEHPNFLMSGEVLVVTESSGVERLKAPLSMISPAGTKRIVYTIEDTTWITVHEVGQERDLGKIEDIVIAKSYDKLELQSDEAHITKLLEYKLEESL